MRTIVAIEQLSTANAFVKNDDPRYYSNSVSTDSRADNIRCPRVTTMDSGASTRPAK